MKKLFTLIIVALLGTNVALAQVGWSYNSNTKTMTVSGSGAMGSNYQTIWRDYDIASVTIGDNVTSIGGLSQCTMQSVTIGNSVTSIGNDTFKDCSGLTSVTIPNSVASIGQQAFGGCSGLTSVTIPNSVTSISPYTFASCSGLTSVTIPNSVYSIGEGAFEHCYGLTSVTIPNSVFYIRKRAFLGCDGLTSLTIPNSVILIEDDAFSCNNLKEVSVEWLTPISLASSPIVYASRITLYVPAGTRTLYQNAPYWKDCIIREPGEIGVTDVILNKTTASLAVGDTEQLTATVQPTNATNQQVTWQSNNTSVATVSTSGLVMALTQGYADITATTADGGRPAATCRVTVTIPVTDVILNKTTALLTVGDTEQLTATVQPTNATNQQVTWSSSNTSIATVSTSGLVTAQAAGTATMTVTTADGNKTATCTVTVTAATIPVTSVRLNRTTASLTVGDTEQLTATVQPTNATNKTVTWRSSNDYVATVSESGLVTALAAGTATITATTADGGMTAICNVTVTDPDDGTSQTWEIGTPIASSVKATLNGSTLTISGTGEFSWSSYGYRDEITTVVISNGITNIDKRAFSNVSSLVSVTIPNSVTSIGEWAFSGCSSLTSLTIPNSVTSIGEMTFYDCSSLTSVTIPNSVTSIGERAFYNCNSLTSLTISNSVASIGEQAFFGCSSLTSLTIPNSVTSIGKYAFSNCSSLTSLTISNSVTSIGENAFFGCSSLTSLTIPNSVTSIGKYAFSCSSLTSVTVEWLNPLDVAEYPFGYGITSKILYVPEGTKELYKNAPVWKDFIIKELGEIGVTGITLNKATTTLTAGGTETLTATVLPANATNQQTTWRSSNTSVATVSTSGLVTAKAAGTATITVTTANGGKTANCVVTVNAVYTVTFNPRGGSSVPAQNVAKGALLTPPTPPTREGYAFAGWFYEVACQNEWFFNSDPVTGNIVLYAKWTEATAIETTEADKLAIYPNPASHDLFIKSDTPIEKVEIFDISGRTVETWRAASLQIQNGVSEKIDISRLNAGIYLVRVSCGDGSTVVKKVVVKQ